MVFSSIIFVFVFLPIFLILYFAVGKLKHNVLIRNILLLAASLFFYYWGEPAFLIIMIISIFINYLGGLGVESDIIKNNKIRKLFLVISVVLNLGILFYFKYFDFAIDSVNSAFNLNIPLKNIVLPIGISFFTFQGMSYVIDVYRGDVKAQKNIAYLALYVSMFPQLVAGPIVRYSDIEKEIVVRHTPPSKVKMGITRFVAGLLKKAVIANTLASSVDEIFSLSVNQINCSTAWLGVLMYALQIYFDFSGYSDMAIGIGHMLGFTFMENFNLPYISKSVKEFWRRWHISLSTWFRDYLYISLGGNRKGNVYVNLLIVFFMTGLWHGASWNFIIWGLWHGLFMIIERIIIKNRKESESENTLLKAIKHIYTLLVVLIGWVLFRADNLSYAWDYLKLMFTGKYSGPLLFETTYFFDNFTIVIFIIAILLSFGIGKYISDKVKKLKCAEVIVDISVFAGLLLCIMFIMSSTYNPFIYFRF